MSPTKNRGVYQNSIPNDRFRENIHMLVVRPYILHGQVSRSLLYSLPMYHVTSPRCLVGDLLLRSATTASVTSLVAAILMSSTWTTSIATTATFDISRNTLGSTRHCSNPHSTKVDGSSLYHDRSLCFSPSRALLSRTTLPDISPHPGGNLKKISVSNSA